MASANSSACEAPATPPPYSSPCISSSARFARARRQAGNHPTVGIGLLQLIGRSMNHELSELRQAAPFEHVGRQRRTIEAFEELRDALDDRGARSAAGEAHGAATSRTSTPTAVGTPPAEGLLRATVRHLENPDRPVRRGNRAQGVGHRRPTDRRRRRHARVPPHDLPSDAARPEPTRSAGRAVWPAPVGETRQRLMRSSFSLPRHRSG